MDENKNSKFIYDENIIWLIQQILQNYIANYVKASVSDIETKISPNSNNNHPY